MPKWTKGAPQLYLDERGHKYYGIPRNVVFRVESHALTSCIKAEHKLAYDNEPWNQFAPNGEPFIPIGHRTPLHFSAETPLRRSINAKLTTFDYLIIGKIGPEGEAPFQGEINLGISGSGGENDLPPHGTVWLAPSRDDAEECIHVSVMLAETHLDALCRELIARPEAILGVRVKFACYQNEYEQMAWDVDIQQTVLIEADAHIPIIEVQLSVNDSPKDKRPGLVGAIHQQISAQNPQSPAAKAINHTALLIRCNWAIGLLLVIIIVLILK